MNALLIGLKHIKTTLGGLAAICAGLGILAPELAKLSRGEPPDFLALKTGGAAIAAGVALLFAKDADKSNAPIPTSTPVATPRGFGALWLLVLLALCLAAFAPRLARAQDADPTAANSDPGAAIADAVANSAPDPRWSLKLGAVTLSPAVSFAPTILSLRDFSLSIGPNVGAGVDVTWRSGWGFAAHGTMRETSAGLKPLASLYAILPPLQRYKLRPGLLYQFSGGALPWRDGFAFGFAIADNFGFPAN